MYVIKGDIKNIILSFRSKTYVLVYNSIRRNDILNHTESLKFIIFLYPHDLNEHFFENRLNCNITDLLLIDEYQLFQEEELWNKVKSICSFFNTVMLFNSLKKNQIDTIIDQTHFESVFIHSLYFYLRFSKENHILICDSQAMMNIWILLFQQSEVSAKVYLSNEHIISDDEFLKYKCHIFKSAAHISIKNDKDYNKISIFHFKTFKLDLDQWSKRFTLYNPNLKVKILSLKKSNVWKDLFKNEKFDQLSKALFHRLWEFFYV